MRHSGQRAIRCPRPLSEGVRTSSGSAPRLVTRSDSIDLFATYERMAFTGQPGLNAVGVGALIDVRFPKPARPLRRMF